MDPRAEYVSLPKRRGPRATLFSALGLGGA